MEAGEHEVFGRAMSLSSLERMVFPDAGLRKRELVDYHIRIAQRMLPWVRARPLALKRWPRGLGGESFFQKQAGDHFPDWIERVRVQKRGGTVDHVVVDEPATIVYLANQSTIELHGWLACADDLERPDQVIIDLDPPEGADVGAVRTATRYVGGLLDELGLDAWLKTSGSKGYHVHIPIERRYSWQQIQPFTRGIAAVLAARHPGRLTDEFHKSEREGRVFVDTLRNAYAQTAVVPYSLRGRSGAPVATPLRWDELGRVDPRRYTMQNIFRRLAHLGTDPWAGWRPQRLDDAFERLRALL